MSQHVSPNQKTIAHLDEALTVCTPGRGFIVAVTSSTSTSCFSADMFSGSNEYYTFQPVNHDVFITFVHSASVIPMGPDQTNNTLNPDGTLPIRTAIPLLVLSGSSPSWMIRPATRFMKIWKAYDSTVTASVLITRQGSL